MKPELLAPAGNIESFFAAVKSGADAIYLGLKKFSARATASNFTIDQLASLMPFAHKRGVRIYIALNAQIISSQMSELLDTLNCLSSLKPDGLIVQDAGIFHLLRHWFPTLKPHASTLAAVHNSAGVKALQAMGAVRVVLARELSLEEIEEICDNTEAELEIFIHGALCYSYSGMCLASSFRGGRSGLRGECVQPCRLKFRQGSKEGFFLSCSDLCAAPAIPRLKRLRIAGLKIEGRMKPAAWVADVVSAYRLILDAESAEEERLALIKANALLTKTPSRRLSGGHLGLADAAKILAPHRSGSSGAWSATVKSVLANRVLIDLRYPIAKGDRLRPESSIGREEEAFTVSQLFDVSGQSILSAQAGVHVYLATPKTLRSGDRLFKVGTKSEPPAAIWKKIREEVPSGLRLKSKYFNKTKILDGLEKPAGPQTKRDDTVILKVDSAKDLLRGLQSPAAMVFLRAARNNLEHIARQKFSPARLQRLGLSLPAVIAQKDVEYFRAAVGWFISKGFHLWEINNWGHFDLTGQDREVRLVAGSKLNLRNSAAFAQAVELGCRWIVVSIETTREELKELAETKNRTAFVLTVYCWPPLFTSRLMPALHTDRPFLSARNEAWSLATTAGRTEIYADRPVSWLEQLPLLRSLGYSNFMIDASEGPAKRPELMEVMSAFAAARSPTAFSLFNLERRP
ncbi:MAG TPA: peptidase U32 family protein [Syntrophobacteraceae bacterium]|nr:peptidase U32 family protein [Syntrophobacteraceae bacterium]